MSQIRVNLQKEIEDAAKLAEDKYIAENNQRRKERILQAERVLARKIEQRYRYLQESPSIRSAARPLKERLIKENITEEGYIICFYCSEAFEAEEIHLEHKIPISRNGTNNLRNLVLACASCNLKKGRKTHDEFLRSQEED